MKQLILLPFLLFYTTLQAQDISPIGHWRGALTVNGTTIPVVFHINQDSQGEWSASFDSPDQYVYDMAFDEINIIDAHVRLRIKAANIVYEGTLQKTSQTIEGTWSQGNDYPLILTPTEDQGPNRPQTPKDPFPYDVETVEFTNKQAGINLAGTLTLPESQQNCPAVVLISGSGPQDRNSNIMSHKSFWVIADYLTRRGMVVLRVDDRGVGKSGGTFAGATSADFATDVEAAFAYLKKHPRVNANKVGLMGHSEGGLIAPMVASSHKDVAFVVLLAGPGYLGSQVLQQQNYDLLWQETKDRALVERYALFLTKAYAAILTAANQDKSTSEMMVILQEDIAQLSKEDLQKLHLTESSLRNLVAQLRTPWMRAFLASNPEDYLTQVSCPVLAIHGEKDIQVHVKNLKGIEAALKKGNNSQYSIQAFENLNHLLQTAETGAIEEYAIIEETLAPEVLAAIDEWLKKIAIY